MKIEREYKELLITIKQKVREAQLKAILSANGQMLLLYYLLGNYILESQHKQGWGAKIIDRLSTDLKKEFPGIKGFSPRNMLYMKQFAETYPVTVLQYYIDSSNEIKKTGTITGLLIDQLLNIENQLVIISQPPVAKLEKKSFSISQPGVAKLTEELFLQCIIAKISWAHHIILINKVKNRGQRFWYMLQTIENGMSRDILSSQIESRLFERQVKAKKITNFSKTLPETQTDFANYMIKDPYIFDFVQLKEKADERNIEQQLTEHITKFLLELGQGFAFIGRQVHFEVGKQDFYIDLLFYHTKLHTYIVVELKSREFEPEDAGKLNFYINLVNDKLKNPADNDTIGILLCKGKNEVLAEYALKNIKQPIGVSDYQLSKAIPEELKSQLPDVLDLEQELLNDLNK